MKYLLTFLLSLGAVTAVSCKSATTAEMKSSTTVLEVTGMT